MREREKVEEVKRKTARQMSLDLSRRGIGSNLYANLRLVQCSSYNTIINTIHSILLINLLIYIHSTPSSFASISLYMSCSLCRVSSSASQIPLLAASMLLFKIFAKACGLDFLRASATSSLST